MVLLDSDVAIDLLRSYAPALDWLDSLGDEEILLPGLVIMELIQGCRNKVEQDKLEKELDRYLAVWPSTAMCKDALSTFSQHHLSSGLGILDALIGQTAVGLDLPLHTFNQKHYSPISELQTIQPYQKSPS